MDARILSFNESLKKQLEDLPKQEVEEALSYYEEYLNEADEAGKDLNEILEELGSPENIAGIIRMENSIIRAQRSPGLKNFTKVLTNAFHGVKTPLTIFLLSIFVIVSFSVVAMFYAGALVTFIGAVVIAMGFIYEALKIPLQFTMDVIGTLGVAFFGAGILFMAAYGLYKLGRLMVRVSTRQIRWIQSKSGKPMPDVSEQKSGKKSNFRRIILTCAAISVLGLVLSSVSGLPLKYFTIFNSMKPGNISMRTAEFDPAEINKISVTTAHSCIKLIRNSSDKIIISYEQPDWLDYEVSSSGSMLSFYEKSNGRLPLFKLATLHESRTELIVSIPENYSPEVINVETTGGFVNITGLDENINVKTYTGSVFLKSQGSADNYNIIGDTGSNSLIEVDGKNAGQETNKGKEYYRNVQAKKTIEIHSSSGNISIEHGGV